MPAAGDLPPIMANQVQTLTIDFGKFLPVGVKLQGTPTLRLSVLMGNDRRPQSHLQNGPQIGTAPISQGGTGLTDTAILFQVGGCVPGVTYAVDVYCNRSDGDVAEATTKFVCIGP